MFNGESYHWNLGSGKWLCGYLEKEWHLENVTSCLKNIPKSQCLPFFILNPRLWNKLPALVKSSVSLTQFKKQLKTHLFKQAFDLMV